MTKEVHSSDFAEEVRQRQGNLCAVPACGAAWTDVAHVWPSGMGGRPSSYQIDNLVGLCHPCHTAFDGNRAWMMRTLMEDRMIRVRLAHETTQAWAAHRRAQGIEGIDIP
jgi:hypothetical protein